MRYVFGWDILVDDDAGAQVAIIYSHLDLMWSLDVLGQVMY